ncbi:MAG: hypothetical protein V6Z81_09835 [Parvularculales bacterium]
MELDWIKCQNNRWCSFERLKLNNLDYDGVYVIFFESTLNTVVRVGQGNIKERISAHRSDSEITKYAKYKLLVTWARVANSDLNGVEAFLGDFWDPLVGDNYPDVEFIRVNSPF